MIGFWIYAGIPLWKGSEYSRIPSMAGFCICKHFTRLWIRQNRTELCPIAGFWICLVNVSQGFNHGVAASFSLPLRVNRQSYELEIWLLFIKFYLEQRTGKKKFVGRVQFAHWAFCRGWVKLIGYQWCAN